MFTWQPIFVDLEVIKTCANKLQHPMEIPLCPPINLLFSCIPVTHI